MGHSDHEISATFSTFDQDGNHVLDEEEQRRMKQELEAKRVGGGGRSARLYIFIYV